MTSSDHAIVLATDARFLAPISCVLAMIEEHSADAPVVIMHDAVPEPDRRRATSHVPTLDVTWTDVSSLLGQQLQTPQHFTRMSYARLLIARALPSVDRAVYLDGDILIRRSIDPLFAVDLHGLPIGACRDLNAMTIAQGFPNFADWQLDGDAPYFNGGVLVLDLRLWREQRLTDEAVAIAEESSASLGWADQDVINIVVGNQCRRLDATWNLLHGGWGRRAHRSRIGGALPAAEIGAALRDPAIVHFAGSIKPWHPRFGGRLSTPRYREWRRFASRSPYARELLGGPRRAIERTIWSPLVRPADALLRWRERHS
ncbi:MAG TPA: glycosyltransferase family 8 protein [Acidimicrobiales bacterium]|nr:glycosyltransferase family 8 protein [Acidimicrobiales bacterium]